MHPLPLPHALGTLQGSLEASRRGGDPLVIPGLRGIGEMGSQPEPLAPTWSRLIPSMRERAAEPLL